MKKIVCLIATIIIFSIIAGCAENQESSIMYTTTEDGSRMQVTERATTIFPDNLPASLDYNGKNIILSSVSAYQDKSEKNYSYNLFVVVTLDVSALEDDEIHWLRESDLDMSVFLTCEDNEYDFVPMSSLGNLLLTDEKKIHFVVTSSFTRENRYSFAESDISVVPTVELRETYEYINKDGETRNLHKENSLHYRTTLPADIPTSDEIDDPLYTYIATWLYEEAGFYADLIKKATS